MQPIGPKLAEGRDSEIFEHGPGKVLRVARDGRSLVAEAEVMRYARSHSYPCPDVYDAGDGYLVMDRLDGPTMMEMVGKPPFPLRRSGHLLAVSTSASTGWRGRPGVHVVAHRANTYAAAVELDETATITPLRQEAKRLGVEGRTRMTKAELATAIADQRTD